MNKTTVDKTSVQIAAMALVVSLLSSGFAIYQWWTSGRDEKIRATIDVSNKYTEEAVDPNALADSYEIVKNKFQSGTRDFTDKLQATPILIKKHFERLEYISYLANRDKLATGYLSQFVICDIERASDDLTNLKTLIPGLPDNLAETNKFAIQHNANCADKKAGKETDEQTGKETESSK
jgi:hypothetical protein